VPTIKKISFQTLKCLSSLHSHSIIHCDLKPENILVHSSSSTSVKIIDFGSSCFSNQQLYSYIQSRFYRAPEIVLGCSYSTAIDTWSFGCVLAELYTGLPIFPAENEKELIACICEVIGEPAAGFVASAPRAGIYFAADGKARPFKNTKGRRRVPGARPLRSILKGADEEFVELIAECLKWDPRARITPDEALKMKWLGDAINSPRVSARFCKISMEDIIKHTPKLKKLMSHRMKPSAA
jgi:dual specificity tyrosine-phosphorylation-regulated kinase 2/3/4